MLGQVDSIVTRLGLDNCDNIELLKEPCKKLKVPRPAYLVLGVLVVVVVSIVVGLAGSLLTNVLGMVYPAY